MKIAVARCAAMEGLRKGGSGDKMCSHYHLFIILHLYKLHFLSLLFTPLPFFSPTLFSLAANVGFIFYFFWSE